MAKKKTKATLVELVFTAHGTAELYRRGEDEPEWTSDDDEKFLGVVNEDFLDPERDTDAIVEYLEDQELLSEEEELDVVVEEVEDDASEPLTRGGDEDDE